MIRLESWHSYGTHKIISIITELQSMQKTSVHSNKKLKVECADKCELRESIVFDSQLHKRVVVDTNIKIKLNLLERKKL